MSENVNGGIDLDKALQSAPFKRDYITFLAIGLFMLVIVLELALMVWLPVQLKLENLWHDEVARQKMVRLLDGLRKRYEDLGAKSKRQEEEVKLVRDRLDDMARYVREYNERLRRSQVSELAGVLEHFERYLLIYEKGGQVSKELTVDPPQVLERIFSRLGGRSAKEGCGA